MRSIVRLLAVSLALIACTSVPPVSAPSGSATQPQTASETAPAPAASFAVENAGLQLVAAFDRLEVEPGGTVTVRLTILNGRPDAARFQEPCDTDGMTVELPVPVEPIGRQWDGLAGAFKTYALEQSTGSPIESSVRTPMKTVAKALPCHAAVDEVDPSIPLGTYKAIPAGGTYETVMTWSAELVRDLPAGPGEVPFSIQVLYDQVAIDGGMAKFETLEVTGTITIVPGSGPDVVSAGGAIDAVLADPQFAAWLPKQPRKSWANANLFLQPGAVGVDVLPEVPYWDVELFREPRNWAMLYVDATSGAVVRTNFCDIPCDR